MAEFTIFVERVQELDQLAGIQSAYNAVYDELTFLAVEIRTKAKRFNFLNRIAFTSQSCSLMPSPEILALDINLSTDYC